MKVMMEVLGDWSDGWTERRKRRGWTLRDENHKIVVGLGAEVGKDEEVELGEMREKVRENKDELDGDCYGRETLSIQDLRAEAERNKR